MIRTIQEIDLRQKTVLLRVDFNVPVEHGKVTEPHRIDSALPTLRLILEKANKVLLASHLGRPEGRVVPEYSLAPVRDYLETVLKEPVVLAPDCVGSDVERLVRESSARVIMLENLRFHKEEEKNDPDFARALASLADVYVNDAFGAAHRAHASIAGVAPFFREKAAGLLLQKEIDYLGRVLSRPERPFVAILGGAKVSDKIGVIKNLLSRVDTLLIGGAMAYTFLKARGIEIGASRVENDRLGLAADLLTEAAGAGIALLLPVDHVTADARKEHPEVHGPGIPQDRIGLDIGPETIEKFAAEIRKARMVLWNGPLGMFETRPFDRGSAAIAKAVAESPSRPVSIIAGGDTVAAVTAAGLQDRMTHLSTGGGATLEFLEGRTLPGIKALEEQA
ncbi:MAG TPA: phosphoglycerate kinase [candidate division Zixibacteria bacterium]|nr:phosphoglycerate kinase [candidate division Zixibacteria bacterium]